jgi:hypothetical protein
LSLALVPIPRNNLEQTGHIWAPFIEGISKRTGCPTWQHMSEIYSGAVEIMLAYDGDTAHALAGVRYLRRGSLVDGVIIWCTGANRKRWFPLIDEIEKYLREHKGCAKVTAIARPGWTRPLKARGYRVTHIQFEKEL